jgi:hypothetical protein
MVMFQRRFRLAFAIIVAIGVIVLGIGRALGPAGAAELAIEPLPGSERPLVVKKPAIPVSRSLVKVVSQQLSPQGVCLRRFGAVFGVGF